MKYVRGRFTVFGRVQGVGFRYSAQHRARAIGLTGWVQNLPDGSVAALAEGSGEQVAEFREWLGHGPTFARVDRLEADQEGIPAREFRDFRII